MAIKRKWIALIIGTAGVLASFDSSAADALLLKHGLYVIAGQQCRGAPNAALLSWDGVGFSGAHSRKCSSKVQHQHGAWLQVDTTCEELGDGTENSSAANHIDSFSLKLLSMTRFKLNKDGSSRIYRWCRVDDPA